MTTTRTKADEAVLYLLNAIIDDGRKAYLLGKGTRCFEVLTEAYCQRTGENLEQFRERFWSNCNPERVVPAS